MLPWQNLKVQPMRQSVSRSLELGSIWVALKLFRAVRTDPCGKQACQSVRNAHLYIAILDSGKFTAIGKSVLSYHWECFWETDRKQDTAKYESHIWTPKSIHFLANSFNSYNGLGIHWVSNHKRTRKLEWLYSNVAKTLWNIATINDQPASLQWEGKVD